MPVSLSHGFVFWYELVDKDSHLFVRLGTVFLSTAAARTDHSNMASSISIASLIKIVKIVHP
jgi:hypothetical protein